MDREDPFLTLDSMGNGVMSFNVEVANDAPTGSFTSTAVVRLISKQDIDTEIREVYIASFILY